MLRGLSTSAPNELESDTEMFAIKPGYRENPGPVYFLDDVTETRGLVFQPDVYTLAEFLAELTGANRIVDVGCGWGDKLAGIHERHPDWQFLGIDYDVNIAHCRDTYDWGTWAELDLETQGFSARGGVVVCSDVVEHLVDPRNLIHSLRDSGAPVIVISTPERDVQHGALHEGPSPNRCHVREWNVAEFREFLTAEGLTVHHQGLTRGHDQSWIMPTQLAICT